MAGPSNAVMESSGKADLAGPVEDTDWTVTNERRFFCPCFSNIEMEKTGDTCKTCHCRNKFPVRC